MKVGLTVLIILIWSSACAQDFDRVDATVLKYPKQFSKSTNLSKRINDDFMTDSNKARAVYTWMINNISYSYEDTTTIGDLYNYHRLAFVKPVANYVLNRRATICAGCACLYKQLCTEVGVKCFYVTGYARNDFDSLLTNKEAEHAWNIVVLNNKKYLVDATWGAGTYNKKFKRDTTYHYFLTKPYVFLRNHYAALVADRLIGYDIKWQEFNSQPFYFSNTAQRFIQLIYPKTFKLNGGEKYVFKLYNKLNEAIYSYALDDAPLETIDVVKEGRFDVFNLALKATDKVEDLIIYMNNEALLGFKIVPKKK